MNGCLPIYSVRDWNRTFCVPHQARVATPLTATDQRVGDDAVDPSLQSCGIEQQNRS